MARFGLSRRIDYAVIALARLAQRREAGDGDAAAGLLSARELAEADGLPLPVLGGLLKQLHRAGLVASRRGVRGGYWLREAPERVRLAAVIRAVEQSEPVQLARCCGPDGPGHHDDACRIACNCPIRHAIQDLDRRLSRFLEELTLAELLADGPAVKPTP